MTSMYEVAAEGREQYERWQEENGREMFIVVGPRDHVEILDELPKWDWKALGQKVYVADVNGGDSAEVIA